MPKHPAWYLNLAGRPARRDPGAGPSASTSSPAPRRADEKPRLWAIVNEVWPNYDVYQSRTDRVIPVVVLTPDGLIGRLRSVPAAHRAEAEGRARRRNGTRGPANTEALLAAAHRLVLERGENFTTQDLIKEADVALQTFYRHFGGKDQILLAVVGDLIAGHCEALAAQGAGIDDPVERLHFYVIETLSAARRQTRGRPAPGS